MACKICGNETLRETVREALKAGRSYRHIAAGIGISPSSVFRHCREHVISEMLSEAATQIADPRAFDWELWVGHPDHGGECVDPDYWGDVHREFQEANPLPTERPRARLIVVFGSPERASRASAPAPEVSLLQIAEAQNKKKSATAVLAADANKFLLS